LAGPVLAFPSKNAGLPVLWKHCLQLRPPRQGYLFADALIDALNETGCHYKPSNGAIMIGLAAALNPQWIVVAGIDLYEHPGGRYPSDALAVDGYSRDHNRECDIDFICKSLEQYQGETLVIGDALREALHAKGCDARFIDITAVQTSDARRSGPA
jgi:hypothetical protein